MNGPRPSAKLVPLAFGLVLMIAAATAAADGPRVPAFPGAEGYGRFARGGRGGDVYHVTNLEDGGPGSLRAGLERLTGPRTIVFDISGTIRLASDLKVTGINGLTIAGQTAPGDGITLRDHTLKFDNVSDVIVRYLRVRLGDESKTSSDTIGISRARNMILDHVTATWGVDGNMDTEYLSDFTLQWSLFGEALHRSTHQKGPHAVPAVTHNGQRAVHSLIQRGEPGSRAGRAWGPVEDGPEAGKVPWQSADGRAPLVVPEKV